MEESKAIYKWTEVGALLQQGLVIQGDNSQYRMKEGKLESKYLPIAGGQWREAVNGIPPSPRTDWVVVDPGYAQVDFVEFLRWAFRNPTGTYRVGRNHHEAEVKVSSWVLCHDDAVPFAKVRQAHLDAVYFIPETGDRPEKDL